MLRKTINYKGNVINLGDSPRDKKSSRKTTEYQGRTFNLPESLRDGTGEDEVDNFYIWRTRRDSNVRSSHAEREGKIFRWDDPPDGGHPGEDYGCRCWAAPVTADVTLVADNNSSEDKGADEFDTEAILNELIDKEKHFKRNELNRPPTFQEALDSWKVRNYEDAALHRGPDNENNIVFESPDGHREAVFRPSGALVTDPRYMGTYNYYPKEDWKKHILEDVIPYILYGNSADDPSTRLERLVLTLKGFNERQSKYIQDQISRLIKIIKLKGDKT
ncbi:MAG: phage minor head protein [Nitrospinales bacterium]